MKGSRWFKLTRRVWAVGQTERVRGLVQLMGAHGVTLGLGVLTSALIFRSLGPGDMGRLALALGVVGILSLVSEFGLRDAAVNYTARFLNTDPERVPTVLHTYLFLRVGLSFLAMALGLSGATWIASQFYPHAELGWVIQLAALRLIGTGLMGVTQVVLEGHRQFGAVSRLRVVEGVSKAGGVFVLFGGGWLTLGHFLLLEALVPLGVFAYSLHLWPVSVRRWGWPQAAMGGLLLRFSRWIALAAVASIVFMKLDVLLLSYFRPAVEVGIYSAAATIIARMGFLKAAVLTTAFPEASRQTTAAGLRHFVRESLVVTGVVSLGLGPLFWLGEWVIVLLYGQAYAGAGGAFYILLIGFLVSFNTQPLGYVLYALNKLPWVAARELWQLLWLAGLGWVLIPRFGLLGGAGSLVLAQLAGAVWTVVTVGWFLYVKPSELPLNADR